MDAGTAHIVSWSEPTKGHVPPPLTGPSITISPLPAPHPPTVFLFGGKSVETRRLTSEVWAMDLATRMWGRVDAGTGPGPRYFHSMDVWQDKLVCFGGMSDSDPMAVHNDIWFFDCVSRRWLPQVTAAPDPSAVGLGIDTSAQDPDLLPSARYAHLSAISRGQLIISGGQHSDNSWIYEVNVYDLQNRVWVSKTEQPHASGMFSKGAYRSVATSSKKRVVTPKTRQGSDIQAAITHSYSVDEEGEGGDVVCYSNYDFAKVRRELDIISPNSHEIFSSPKHTPPPGFMIRDESHAMRGSSQPPGLRFPTGGIVGNYFILCGLYLASVSGAFSIWALNLETMTWKHLEPQVLTSGSWNRALVWADKGKVLVFGNSASDLSADYSRRAVNLDHIAVISLEAFGIYQPPTLVVPTKVQQAGLSMLDEKLASDFQVICDDGRRVKCAKKILTERWSWLAEQERELEAKVQGAIADSPSIDINDTLLGSFTPARLTPATLTLSEPFPVCVALVQYFYTLSLATPLQNRAPVLSALLFMAKQYNIDRLNKLVVHALHERLDFSNAVGIYEIATLAAEQCLQVRALNLIHSAKTSMSRRDRQGPASLSTGEGNAGTHQGDASQARPGPPGSTAPGGAGVPSGATRPGGIDDAPHRRARADSLTVPIDVIEALPISDALQDEDQNHEKVTALLEAMNVDSNPAASPSRRPSLTARVSDRSLTPPASALPPVPAVPQRHHLPLPPLAPPPLSRPPSFPRTPDFSGIDKRSSARSSSPTNSEATSTFPSTPSDSLRESWILPQHRDWSLSSGLGAGMMDSRSSSSSGMMGLPSLPENGAITPRTFGNVGGSKDGTTDYSISKKLSLNTTEQSPSALFPPASLREGFQQVRTDSPTMSQSSLCFDNSSVYGASPVSRRPSTNSSPGYLSTKNQRHYSIATQSSGASAVSSNNPLSPTGTEWSDDVAGPLHRQYTVTSARSQYDCASSISSGSTGTSSKKVAKAEAKALKAVEKAVQKADAQKHFIELRAQQQKKMALSRADAQRRADIAAAQAKQLAEERAKKVAQPKSRWGKIASGVKDAVLFPEGGANSTMF